MKYEKDLHYADFWKMWSLAGASKSFYFYWMETLLGFDNAKGISRSFWGRFSR